MKIQFRLNGIEPEVTTVRNNKSGGTSTYTISLFYPFRYLMCKVYNRNTKKYLSKQKYPVIKCEGCGMGWAEWEIRDPNTPSKKPWKVCNHCVDLYDWNLSKLRLEIKWRMQEDDNLYRNR